MAAGKASTETIRMTSFVRSLHISEASTARGPLMRPIANAEAISRERMKIFRGEVRMVLRSLSLFLWEAEENWSCGLVSTVCLSVYRCD